MRGWDLTLQGRMVASLAALALCGAVMTRDEHACLAAALLISPLLVDWLWKSGGLPVLAVRVAPRRCQAGSPFLETVGVRNDARRRAAREVRLVEPRLATRAGGGVLEDLPPGASDSIRLPARCLRRGRHATRTFRCETTYPLGLLRARSDVRCEAEIVCEPARVALPPDLLRAAGDCAAATLPSPRGVDEFFALREYRDGDDARLVHALRSASAGVLVRKITRGEAPRHPCIVLDLRRAPGRTVPPTSRRFEWSLGAAATLVDELHRHGAETACVVLARHSRVFRLGAAAEAEDLLTFLAEVRPSPYALAPDDLLELVREHQTCLWIPAGGFAAREDRASVRGAVLVTVEHDA